MVNLKVTLLDGAYHEVDSLGNGVQDRGQVLKGCRTRPVILEPIMAVEVTTPERTTWVT